MNEKAYDAEVKLRDAMVVLIETARWLEQRGDSGAGWLANDVRIMVHKIGTLIEYGGPGDRGLIYDVYEDAI